MQEEGDLRWPSREVRSLRATNEVPYFARDGNPIGRTHAYEFNNYRMQTF